MDWFAYSVKKVDATDTLDVFLVLADAIALGIVTTSIPSKCCILLLQYL